MSSYWSGTWYSTRYTFPGFASGCVILEIPDDFLTNGKVETVATIRYDGIYRHTEEVKIPISIDLNQGNEYKIADDFHTPAGQYKNESVPDTMGKLTFTVSSKSNDKIKGTYKLNKPHDFGEFELMKGRKWYEEKRNVVSATVNKAVNFLKSIF